VVLNCNGNALIAVVQNQECLKYDHASIHRYSMYFLAVYTVFSVSHKKQGSALSFLVLLLKSLHVFISSLTDDSDDIMIVIVKCMTYSKKHSATCMTFPSLALIPLRKIQA